MDTNADARESVGITFFAMAAWMYELDCVRTSPRQGRQGAAATRQMDTTTGLESAACSRKRT